MADKAFRVALVGCGVISYNHIAAIKATDNVKLTALCDIKPERAQARVEEFELDAKVYTDYIEMLDTEKPNAVHIATPHYLHAEMAAAALRRNIYVCLEKPICISLEEIDMLLEEERKSRAKVCVVFQNRFNRAYMEAKRLADEDGIQSAYISVFWERDNEYYMGSDWRGRYATEGGGVMINQAIHSIDYLTTLLGKPLYVTATKANHKHKGIIEVEDSCEGLIEFESGNFGSFFATTSYTADSITTIFIRTKNHRIHLIGNALYIDSRPIELPDAISYLGKAVYGDGHIALIKSFYSAIVADAEMPVTLESAQWALRLLLAAYKSDDKKIKI